MEARRRAAARGRARERGRAAAGRDGALRPPRRRHARFGRRLAGQDRPACGPRPGRGGTPPRGGRRKDTTMSTIDTDRFRTMLLEERERVRNAIEYLHEETPGALEDETEEIIGSVDNHPAETATATLDREIDYTLEENSEQVLAQIDE